jgi:hypothetical protein
LIRPHKSSFLALTNTISIRNCILKANTTPVNTEVQALKLGTLPLLKDLINQVIR